MQYACAQAVFYLLWGHALVCWSLWFASYYTSPQEAVLFCIAVVVFMGLVANLVVLQFVQAGPRWAASVLEAIAPPFALFR